MNCENCCEAFVGTYEGYYVSKDDKKMRVCSCCKNEYVMMGWIGIKVEEPDDDEGSTTNEDDDEEVNPYMEELIECRRCEIEKPRKNMYWNTIGSYTDVCEDCEHEAEIRRQKFLNRPPEEKIQCVVCEEPKATYSIGVKCKTCKNSMCQVCCCEYSLANEDKFKSVSDETGYAVDIFIPCPICRTINSFGV